MRQRRELAAISAAIAQAEGQHRLAVSDPEHHPHHLQRERLDVAQPTRGAAWRNMGDEETFELPNPTVQAHDGYSLSETQVTTMCWISAGCPQRGQSRTCSASNPSP